MLPRFAVTAEMARAMRRSSAADFSLKSNFRFRKVSQRYFDTSHQASQPKRPKGEQKPSGRALAIAVPARYEDKC